MEENSWKGAGEFQWNPAADAWFYAAALRVTGTQATLAATDHR